jgi:hypothetical protein
MSHPFLRLSDGQRHSLLQASTGMTIILMVTFAVIGGPLTTSSAPNGIVSFELAFTASKAQAILDSWDATATLLAVFGLGLDYLLMLMYATALSLGCLWAGQALHLKHWPLASVAIPLAWLQVFAAILDAVENLGLLVITLRPVNAGWILVAGVCAAAKFALLFSALVYIFYALAIRFVTGLRPAKAS